MTDAPETSPTFGPEQPDPQYDPALAQASAQRGSADRSAAWLGSAVLWAGGLVLALALMDSTYGIPFSMPRFWYVNRTLWMFLGLASIPAGWALLKYRPRVQGWRPSQPGVRFKQVIVYTRPGCHLCDEALALLQQYREWLPAPDCVDIDEDPALHERFRLTIPVIECDGVVRFRGRVDEFLLQRLIEGAPPRNTER